MKKKIFSILLCLILLFTLTACASSNPEGSTDTVTNTTGTESDSEIANTDNSHENIDSGDNQESIVTENIGEENKTEDEKTTEGTSEGNGADHMEPAVVSIHYASEDLLAQPDAFYEIITDDSDMQVKVTISTNSSIQQLKVLSLDYEDADDTGIMRFRISEELYSLDELTSQKPLVIAMSFPGVIPNIGISYTDTDGTEKKYAISMSGEDDTLLLLESVF